MKSLIWCPKKNNEIEKQLFEVVAVAEEAALLVVWVVDLRQVGDSTTTPVDEERVEDGVVEEVEVVDGTLGEGVVLDFVVVDFCIYIEAEINSFLTTLQTSVKLTIPMGRRSLSTMKIL